MKITLKKIEQGVCPYCGSTKIEYNPMELEDDYVYYTASCYECKRAFEEWYKLEFAGHNVGDNFEIALSPYDEDVEIEVSDDETV